MLGWIPSGRHRLQGWSRGLVDIWFSERRGGVRFGPGDVPIPNCHLSIAFLLSEGLLASRPPTTFHLRWPDTGRLGAARQVSCRG
jgi:hypothetical protein